MAICNYGHFLFWRNAPSEGQGRVSRISALLEWKEECPSTCLLSRGTLWCLWWLFPLRQFWSRADWWPYKKPLGPESAGKAWGNAWPITPPGYPWEKNFWCAKIVSYGIDFSPSYSYATLHLLNRRSELSRVSPLAASWIFLLLFWLFSGLKHQVWFTHSSSCQTPMYRAVRVCFCWGNRTVRFPVCSIQPTCFFFSENKGMLPLALVIYSN